MKNKILIFGKGYIGERVRESLNCVVSGKKICSLQDAQQEINRYKPKIIINCIGHIGRNVDDCELDKDKTLMANSFIPIILAEAALRNKIKLVHISSGCIYNYDYRKDTPIGEKKLPDFFDLFYSRSKIYSERALEVMSNKYGILIVRLRIPLDNRPHPKNLLNKLIAYKRVIDSPNSVTYIPDFLRALKHLLSINATGIYNVVNKGALYFPDLMKVYKKAVPAFKYEVVDFKKLGLVRTNLILSTAKLEKTGFKVRKIKEVLEECVKNYLKYS
jgi:dTDP-4-dehydrorhamnose reductase